MPHEEAPHTVAMVVNAVAVAVFAALMSLFWWFFASDEMRVQVERKAQLLAVVRRRMGGRNPIAGALDHHAEVDTYATGVLLARKTAQGTVIVPQS